jgi:hypothetical protein
MPRYEVLAIRCVDEVYEIEALDADQARRNVEAGNGTLTSDFKGDIDVQEVTLLDRDER